MKRIILVLMVSVVTSMSVACDLEISTAQEMIQSDGTVNSEVDFLNASKTALSVCTRESTSNELLVFSFFGKKLCRMAANQGQSDTYLAYCLLKVADAISWMDAK